MDYTPQNSASDSGCISSSFDSSRYFYESTPKEDSVSVNVNVNNTPLSYNTSRKRKLTLYEQFNARKLTDVLESCPTTPQFSSTFNESLISGQFETSCHIRPNFYVETYTSQPSKYFKESSPITPEKQVTSCEDFCRKPSSFVKVQSVHSSQSPLKEAHEILYPNLKPIRKPCSPKKFNIKDNTSTPAKKCLFPRPAEELFEKIVSINLIMETIFKYVSNGDLYRVNTVSKSMSRALKDCPKAHSRFLAFNSVYRKNKENYRITPPGSPEKDEGHLVNPEDKNFYYYLDMAKELKHNQTMTKCPRCSKCSIVENNLGQCQDLQSCGYIYCLLCNSFALQPSDFHDQCKNSKLVNNSKSRNTLMDLSNSDFAEHFGNNSSFFCSSFNNTSGYDSSGFCSGNDLSSPSVKRNLSLSFVGGEKPKVLSSVNRVSRISQIKQRRVSLLPVVQGGSPKRPVEVIEPSSPPKVKSYAACSKQSKRNLKRLTR